MGYTVTSETVEGIARYWDSEDSFLRWPSVFALPPWIKSWWEEFGAESEPHVRAVSENGAPIGIAPLTVKQRVAHFMGSPDVCDYMDFPIVPGKEAIFFTGVLDMLQAEGIESLCLDSVRCDSPILSRLVKLATDRGKEVSVALRDVSVDVDLPHTWDEFLRSLTPKQRHEIGRKLRRLREAGDVSYRVFRHKEPVRRAMDIFLELLRCREDKATFMTARMESFFRSIGEALSDKDIVRIGILELDSLPVAAVMYFDYDGKTYLYNSGYERQYSHLSVGLASKLFSIMESIGGGMKKFDFLKGAEEYKYRLGGREIPIYQCSIKTK